MIAKRIEHDAIGDLKIGIALYEQIVAFNPGIDTKLRQTVAHSGKTIGLFSAKLARIADMGKFTSKYSYLQQQLKDIGWRMSAIENKSRELLKAYDEVFGADSSNSTL